MRRFWSALGVVAIAVVLSLVVPQSAQAIGFKKPVDPYPDLPSQQKLANMGAEYYQWVTTKYGAAVSDGDRVRWPVGSHGYQETSGRVSEFLTEKGYAPPSEQSKAKVRTYKTEKLIIDKPGAPGKAVNISSLPKPITAAGAVTRGVAGANIFGSAFLGGFAVGGVGIQLVGLIPGTPDFDSAMCGADEWVQTGYGLLSMGFGPSCKGTIVEPNGDVEPGLGPLNYQGYSLAYLAKYTQSISGASRDTYCFAQSGVVPTGFTRVLLSGGGTYSSVGTGCAFHHGGTTNDYLSQHYLPPSSIPIFGIRQNSTGTVVAQMGVISDDPLREATCELTWGDGSTTTGVVGQYRESEGFPIGVVDAACTSAFEEKQGSGPTVYPTGIGLKSKNNDTGVKTPLLLQDVPEYDAEEKAALEDTTGTGLELWRGTESCLTWAADCSGWWEETDNGQTTTTDYRCTYGGKRVALAQCYVYAPTFDPQTGTETDTPTILDPITGQPTPWSDSEGQNTTDPALGPSPGDVCMGSWSAAPNPVEWVLHPVKCALVWAFVPRTGVVTQTQAELTLAWQGGALGSWVDAITGWRFTLPEGGCSGILVPLSQVWGHGVQDGYILSACPGEPLQPVAAASTVVIGIAAVLGLVFVVTRSIGAIVGYTGLGGRGD